MKKYTLLIALLALAAGGWWYGQNHHQAQGSETVQQWLNSFSQLTYQRYLNLAQSADALHSASETFCQNRSAQNLALTQDAWKTLSTHYARVEAISFGPLSSSGEANSSRKQRLKTWPAQGHNHKVERAIQQLISADNEITTDSLAQYPTQFQSLDALEYLLFGHAEKARTAQCFSGDDHTACDPQRSCQFLMASSANIANLLNRVEQEWRNEFGASLASAGQSGSLYLDQGTAVGDIINGLKSHLILLRNKKVRDPLNSGYDVADPKSLEAWRSQHSLKLLQTNIDSLSEIYSSPNQFGLKNVLLAGGFEAEAQQFEAALQHAKQQLKAMDTSSLRNQLSGQQPDKAAMTALYKAVFELSERYTLDVVQPLPIQNSFNEFDGD
ncbi:conserved hypothetical protein [gamma proteobacterium HTCC5015]|nr:conserved hypothetical protein [gamma proteobacterium HTCC5015]